jgi:hypothetical protein
MRMLLGGVLVAIMQMGCAKHASGDAPSAGQGATAPAEAAPSKDNACGLLTLAEIRRVLPEASRAVRNDNLASQGIAACSWYGSGKAPVLDVSVWDVSGADDTPEENARTLAMGLADPLRAGAQEKVRIQKVAGVGEDAAAVVEKADDAQGILSTGALLSLQKNGRIATVASSDIAVNERSKALDQLATLGKAIAARL